MAGEPFGRGAAAIRRTSAMARSAEKAVAGDEAGAGGGVRAADQASAPPSATTTISPMKPRMTPSPAFSELSGTTATAARAGVQKRNARR